MTAKDASKLLRELAVTDDAMVTLTAPFIRELANIIDHGDLYDRRAAAVVSWCDRTEHTAAASVVRALLVGPQANRYETYVVCGACRARLYGCADTMEQSQAAALYAERDHMSFECPARGGHEITTDTAALSEALAKLMKERGV